MASTAANMGKAFIRSADDLEQLIEASIAFSRQTGKDVPAAITVLSRAINREWFVSLQGMGSQISETAVLQQALINTGKDNIDMLTDLEIRQAAFAFILNESAGAAQDAALYTESYAGRSEELQTQLDNIKTTIGTGLLPFQLAWNELMVDATRIMATMAGTAIGLLAVMSAINESRFFMEKTDWTKNLEELSEALLAAGGMVEEAGDVFSNYDQIFQDILPGDAEFGSINFDDILGSDAESEFDLIGQLEKLLTQEARKRRDAAIDLQRDLEDIEVDGARDRIDALTKYNQDLEDIEREAAEKRADAYTDYLQDIEDANRDFDEKIQEENEDYREEELEQEEDFQEKLRRLREDLLFNLEDALRNRDVRQALRLKQRFDLELEQLRRENEAKKEENQKSLEEELEDIEKQRERKLKELKIEYDRRLQELQLANERERAEA
jgi:hypothetical protein